MKPGPQSGAFRVGTYAISMRDGVTRWVPLEPEPARQWPTALLVIGICGALRAAAVAIARESR